MANGSTGDILVVGHKVTSGISMAAPCHISNVPIASRQLTGHVSDTRICHEGNRCVRARASGVGDGAGVIRGAAELPLIGAYAAREAVAIIFVDAAVAGAFAVARNALLANNKSIFAINPLLAIFCRA